METIKHTKGEWKYVINTKGNGTPQIQVKIPGKNPITLGFIGEDDCLVPTCCKVDDHANAKLIAAAPELLEACNWAVTELEDTNSTPDTLYDTLQKLKNAINKATK